MIPLEDRRRHVLDLRIRLERVAARAFDAVCRPQNPGRQSDVVVRLTFLVALAPHDDRARARRLARLGGHIYVATSDVLHGRARAPSLGDALLDEWRDCLRALEAIVYEGSIERDDAVQRR